eukprot:UN32376
MKQAWGTPEQSTISNLSLKYRILPRHLLTVECLLDSECDVNVVAGDQRNPITALSMAIRAVKVDIVDRLLSKGAKFDNRYVIQANLEQDQLDSLRDVFKKHKLEDR